MAQLDLDAEMPNAEFREAEMSGTFGTSPPSAALLEAQGTTGAQGDDTETKALKNITDKMGLGRIASLGNSLGRGNGHIFRTYHVCSHECTFTIRDTSAVKNTSLIVTISAAHITPHSPTRPRSFRVEEQRR